MTDTESSASDGGLTPYKLRRASGEVDLTPRHLLLVEYMVFGTEHARAKRLGYPLNEPLTLEQAAGVLDIRRRNARQVTRMPAFQRLMAQLTAELRSGGRARAIHTLLKIMADVGENTAADRAVRVKAAKEVIGDEGKGGVNVTIYNQVNAVRPGFIIRLPSDAPTPRTIEATPERPPHPSFAAHRRLESEQAKADELAAEAERARLNPVFRPPSAVSEFLAKYGPGPDAPIDPAVRPPRG